MFKRQHVMAETVMLLESKRQHMGIRCSSCQRLFYAAGPVIRRM